MSYLNGSNWHTYITHKQCGGTALRDRKEIVGAWPAHNLQAWDASCEATAWHKVVKTVGLRGVARGQPFLLYQHHYLEQDGFDQLLSFALSTLSLSSALSINPGNI